MNGPQSYTYEFGDFRVDAAKRLLVSRDGEAIPLTPKVFDTLLYLVEHHGAVLDKDEMMQAIWPHTVVEEQLDRRRGRQHTTKRLRGDARVGDRN